MPNSLMRQLWRSIDVTLCLSYRRTCICKITKSMISLEPVDECKPNMRRSLRHSKELVGFLLPWPGLGKLGYFIEKLVNFICIDISYGQLIKENALVTLTQFSHFYMQYVLNQWLHFRN